MIIFNQISYKNIMSVGNSPTVISLDQHSKTLVTGTNGAGKSTFLEAICFGLFGRPFRKIKKPQLVNSVNKKGLLVEIEFKDHRHSYKVVRGISPNKFEIWRDDVLVEEDASVGDYQEYLEKHILRMNLVTFKQIVVLGTAGFTPFMLLNPAQRREIIEDLLDISVFSTMMDLNKQQLKLVQDDIRDIESKVDKLLSDIRIHTSYEKERRAKSKERLDELTQELTLVVEEFHSAVQDATMLVQELDSVTTEMYNGIDAKITECQQQLANLNAEARQIKQLSSYVQSNDCCSTCGQAINDELKTHTKEQCQEKISELTVTARASKEKFEALKKEKSERDGLLEEIQQIQQRIKLNDVSKENARTKAIRIKADIVAIKSDDEKEDKTALIKNLALDVREFEKEKVIQNQERYCREIVTGILKDSGVKKMIIRKYIPSINRFINGYLKQLGANYNFVLDEEFNETIKSRGRDNFSYSSFSQGERARIDLAMLFAFRDLVSARTGAITNLLVMDEILDSAADADGIDSLHKVIGSLKDTNVFIISHSDKHIGFDRHLRMTKVGNFSRTEEKAAY